jgi:hypothetical protein
VADHQRAPPLPRQVDEDPPLAAGQGERLLDEEVLAGEQGIAADAVMVLGRVAIAGVDRGVAQDLR